MALCAPAHAQIFTGLPVVIDGDTLAIGTERIRLQGIDAPELAQTCGGWLCGRAAREELVRHIGLGQVTCITNGQDVYGRWLATCSTAAGDIGDWLVRQGLAVAFVRYSTRYVGAEALARAAHKGVWAGPFVLPWEWRARHRE
jgi:endonuclease YncB( thermonuclease family)